MGIFRQSPYSFGLPTTRDLGGFGLYGVHPFQFVVEDCYRDSFLAYTLLLNEEEQSEMNRTKK